MKKFSLAFAFASMFVLSARADITTGLVGYWSLSDGPGSSTVADSSGNGNTGTLVNFSDSTYNNMWAAPGDPNDGWPFALLFNQAGEGTDTYVSIPDSAKIDTMSANKQWTLSAWVKCSVAGGSEPANAGIIAKGVSGAEAFALYMSGGHFTTVFRNAANNGNETVSGNTTPNAGTWYHVAATVLEPKGSANAEAIIYVNGVLDSGANANTYTTVYSTNLPVLIGARAAANGGVTLAFQGAIDEVRLYNRALTASDIVQLYNNTAFAVLNNGIGAWNGLAGSGGNATLDTTSLNFNTNIYTAPVGTAGSLASVLAVEQAAAIAPECTFGDFYYNSQTRVPVASTNLTIAAGGLALGTASAAGTVTFLNGSVTYTLTSPDGIGLKDGANPTYLVQSSSGTVVLVGNNTFSSPVTNNSGTMQVGNGGSITGQELGTAGTVSVTGTLAFDGNNSLNFTKTVSGTGSVLQEGSGTLTLSTANSYSGGTTITNGAVSAASLNNSGTSLGTGPVNLAGGTLIYTGTGDSTAQQFNGGAGTTNTIDVPNGVNLELSGRVTGTAAWVLNKVDTGTLTLSGSGDNSFLGMNVNAGTVILNKTGGHAIGNPLNVASGAMVQLQGSSYSAEITNSSVAPVTIRSGGALDTYGQSDTFNSLSLAGSGIGGTGALTNSASGATTILTVPITLAADATVGGVGGITLPSPIGGAGGLTYNGSAILTLQATNTYSGGTFVTSGTLDANVSSSIPGNVTLSGTGVLQLDDPNAMSSVATLSLPPSPPASSVNLTFSGTQTIAALVIGSTPQAPGTYGASATNPNNAFTGGGVLLVTGQPYWDPGFTHTSPGSGGTGTWDPTTPNWFLGSADAAWPNDGLAVFAGSAGTVTLGAGMNANGLTFATANYNVASSGASLTLDGYNPTINLPGGNTTIACPIAESGANPVVINGPGTLTLSGANSYAGGTTANGATLSVNTIADANCSIGPSGTLTLLGGGGISYTGGGSASTTRNVNASGAATTYLDVPSGTLALNGPVRNAGGNSTQVCTKTGAGTLVLGGTNDNPSLTMAINQGTVIITKSSATNVHGLGGGTSTVASGATLQLAGTGSYDLYSGCVLTVSSGGVLDLNGQSDTASTLTISGTGIGGTGAIINSASGTPSVLTNNGSGVVLAGPITIGGPGSITLAGKVSGSGPITYASTGTLTLTNANTYTDGTIINSGGTVTFGGAASSAGTGTITDNGTLNVALVGNNAALPNAISGPGIVNMVESSGNNLGLSGSMSAFTGTLNCPTSPGTTAKAQILTTAVNISSAATINVAAGGTFYVSGNGVIIPCPINIYGLGNSEVYGALRLENGALVSGPVTLYGSTTMGNGNAGASKLATISGPISQSGGSYGITFTAVPGTLVLSGTNTYTGPTTISMTTNIAQLVIAGSGTLGGGNYAAPITNSANLNYSSSAAQTLSGGMTGTGSLIQSGPGILTLSGTNSYTGTTLITNGSTLTVTGSGCLGATPTTNNYSGSISNYGTFVYGSSAAQTLSGVLSGTGALVQSGPGTLTLSAANTYTGSTTISNASTLVLASGGSINTTPSISIPAGATLDVSAYTTYSMLGSITLNASGTGTTVGSTAATIKGSSAVAAGVTLNGPMQLTFTPQAFNGDTTHPALYISGISQGQLTLDNNAITVNNAGASPLAAGTYTLIQVVSGGSISAGTPTVTVTGKGLATGATAAIAVSGTSVNLVVTGGVSQPGISSVSLSGTTLTLSGTNGGSGNYYVLSSTNVALPLGEWSSIATNPVGPGGTFSFSTDVGSSPRLFYRIVIP
ncbi:MAG TPA: LamG-like jellyroll fold domain-containing protein [Candidatus Acidoferrum sp.]|nr:LamG-like jellyroll fold domain-containing protein [Candidatus Acidoferrum sp.]